MLYLRRHKLLLPSRPSPHPCLCTFHTKNATISLPSYNPYLSFELSSSSLSSAFLLHRPQASLWTPKINASDFLLLSSSCALSCGDFTVPSTKGGECIFLTLDFLFSHASYFANKMTGQPVSSLGLKISHAFLSVLVCFCHGHVKLMTRRAHGSSRRRRADKRRNQADTSGDPKGVSEPRQGQQGPSCHSASVGPF